MTPNKNFREDPGRSIYICEEITFDLLKQITPKVNELRLKNSEPITVYLDSQGGDPRVANMLLRLLKTPNQDGQRCNIVTVATNYVASAAADILIGGDYSLAYSHATVHYHGTRTTRDGITDEQARLLAAELNRSNEYYANKLARISIYNLAFIRTAFEEQLNAIQDKSSVVYFGPAIDLANFIKSRVSSANRCVISEVVEEIERLSVLFPILNGAREKVQGGSLFDVDLAVLQAAIGFEHERYKTNGGSDRLDANFLSAVERSYNIFRKNEEILNTADYARIFDTIGPLLLNAAEAAEYAKLKQAESRSFLIHHAYASFDLLYTLAVTLGYRLQRGENLLTANDAYMLGMINEVVGSKLPSLRQSREQSSSPPGESQLTLPANAPATDQVNK